jgi:hypothetical protein
MSPDDLGFLLALLLAAVFLAIVGVIIYRIRK